ncbi:MAG TPA: hypothetical protein DDW90_06220 [Cyanobacteria bacterium UBA9971]|nr:hypothetical protein [Cyanobacteria bacterium UBA9971]
MDKDFIKQSVEEQRDVRRNLWISVIAISGALTGIIFSSKRIPQYFDMLLFIKSVIILLGILMIIFFIQEVICCNKEIKKLLRLYNKEK